MLETSCMKGTSVYIKTMRIKQLWNHKACYGVPGAKGFQDLHETGH